MIWKLLEFRNIIDDFNLDKFQRYKINLDKLNKNLISSLNKKENDNLNSDKDLENFNENEIGINKISNNLNIKSSKNVNARINRKKLNDETINRNNL